MLFSFGCCFPTTTLPNKEINPVAAAPISKPKTMGAATTVANNAAPVTPAPNVMVIKTLSAVLVIFAIRKYFSLKASRFVISSSKNFYTSDITFNLYE